MKLSGFSFVKNAIKFDYYSNSRAWQDLLHGQLEKVISSKEMTLFKTFK